MALPTKADFENNIEGFNKLIPDAKLTLALNNVVKYDLAGLLPGALVSAITVLNLSGAGNDQLKAFYNTYYKLMWVNYAWARLLTKQGQNVTQFGITQIVDRDTIPLDPESTARLVNSFNHDATMLLNRGKEYLESVQYTMDGIVYKNETEQLKPKRRFKMIGV